ncbi:C-type lectin domain family 10 member A-like [Perca flavescens]|uniref:C-type lectin domain family 10 member A-like n=1 Tax=Perca flavescens TaxID=8167 RepID=UPI00106EFFA4|nr:C-type lectin domain family 10 member A-like [Perca flavescens]
MIMKFLDYRDKVRVVKAARAKGKVLYKNQQVMFFPDLPTEIHKQQKRFDSVKLCLAHSCPSCPVGGQAHSCPSCPVGGQAHSCPSCPVADRFVSSSEEIKEEEDNYVNVPAWTVDKVAAPPGQRSRFYTQCFLPMAVCWLILLVIMGLLIYFTSFISVNNAKLTAEIQQLETLMQHLNLSKDNETLLAAIQHLTNLNDKLSSDNEKLRRDYDDLTAVNQQLETQRNNLEQIENMETNWNKHNVSRAQWSIDAYCPKTNNGRQCKACQEGWELTEPSCYEVHDVKYPDRKTWEAAEEDCRGKNSHLAVYTQEEHGIISKYSWDSSGTDGYWIGLRAEGGRWKWVDGSDLTVRDWTPQPPPPADVVSRSGVRVLTRPSYFEERGN